jgi:hypothetical protein
MNMFVLRTLLPDVSAATIFSGVLPFMWADVVRLGLPRRRPLARPLAAEPGALTLRDERR